MNDARVFLRPVGNPLPLSFFALAVATLTLSGMQLGWVPAREGKDVALILIGFVFPLQLAAMVFAFLARDGAAAGACGLLAGAWLVTGLVTITSPPGVTSNALGLFLSAVALLLLAPAAASGSSMAAAAAVFAGAALRFAVTGVYEFTAAGSWEDIAGIVGLVLFVLAAYAGLAMTFADARQGSGPLPVGRSESGRPVDSAPTDHLDREPGVRPLL
jgi:uncharacterized protein